jgi:signal transduction histidine kinase
MIKSLKFKFYATFFLLSTLSFIIVLSSNFLTKEEKKIEETEQELNSIYINTLLTSNYIMDFIQNDSRNIRFFETGKSNLIEKIDSLNHNIDLKSNLILQSEVINTLHLKPIFLVLQKEIAFQRTNYKRILSLIRKRGYTEYGYVGKMRSNIHAIETKNPQYESEILSIRRNEKDYMLRLDSNYITKLNTEITQLEFSIQKNTTSIASNDILTKLDLYKKYFDKIVAINTLIGTNENEGIFNSLSIINSNIQSNFQSLSNSLSINKQNLKGNMHSLFLYFSIFTIIIGIISSLYLTNKISKPIIELSRHAHEFVKNKFKISKPLTIQSNNTEIKTWIENYSILEKEIVGLLEEFNQKVAERTQTIEEQNIELKELNATKDKFFSIIAHDLKGPFISVYEFSSKLNSNFTTLTDEKKIKFISNIETISYQTFKLLENLLDWARIQSGHIQLNKKQHDLNEISAEVLEISASMASLKNIQVTNNIPKNSEIALDKEISKTIIRNLVSNAIKFTPNDGRINVTSETKNGFIEICIEDSGVGIPTDKIDKLFKIEENTTTKGTNAEKGTGLGLVLCKELVEKQGGRISVTSILNEGTKVSFTIPR